VGEHRRAGRALPNGTPGASEGQADYFTTKDCLPRLWAPEHRQNAEFRKRVRRAVRQQCDGVWKDVKAQNLCYRSAQTSEDFGTWLAARKQVKAPDLLAPDTSAVTATSRDHPSPQCRVDTLFQGALCPKRIVPGVIPGYVGNRVSLDADVIAANYSCTSGVGARPACWFVPNEPFHDCSSLPTDTCGTKNGQEGRWTCTWQTGPVFTPCADGQVCHDERSGCHGDDSFDDPPAP
jgi:hypothetical protein